MDLGRRRLDVLVDVIGQMDQPARGVRACERYGGLVSWERRASIHLPQVGIRVLIIIDETHHSAPSATMDCEERVRRVEGREASEVNLRLTVSGPWA